MSTDEKTCVTPTSWGGGGFLSAPGGRLFALVIMVIAMTFACTKKRHPPSPRYDKDLACSVADYYGLAAVEDCSDWRRRRDEREKAQWERFHGTVRGHHL